jgi:cellobiose phosphorylase
MRPALASRVLRNAFFLPCATKRFTLSRRFKYNLASASKVSQNALEKRLIGFIWQRTSGCARAPREIIAMKYGYFDDRNREYVITQPDTPLPWINYLGCQEYYGIISNTAGGYSFYRDARLRRLTRYRYNNAPMDLGGRYIYLRDDESHQFWSPSWQPTRHDIENYSCRHGMGYTVIGSTYSGIEAHTRYCAARRKPGDMASYGYQPARNPCANLHLCQYRILPVGCSGRRHQLSAQL